MVSTVEVADRTFRSLRKYNAVTQFAQCRQLVRLKDYLTGQRTYILLSLIAKTALAWQVFAGTLVPSWMVAD